MDNNLKMISLWVPNDFTTGSHTVVSDLSNLTTTYQGSFTFMPNFQNADATSGTINITKSNSDIVEGTFNISGEQDGEIFTVTEGSFRVSR